MYSLCQIEKITNEYITELKAINRKFYPIKVKLGRKSLGTYGTAKYDYEKSGFDVIIINPYIELEADLRNTILHELAHLDQEARYDGHGYHWKRVAMLYSRKYNTVIKRTDRKPLNVPGVVQTKIEWSPRCLSMNPQLLKYNKSNPYIKSFRNRNTADNYIKRYKENGFIDSFEIIEVK